MSELHLPPPGLTAQMSLDPNQLFFQNSRKPGPGSSPGTEGSSKALGSVILGKDTISGSLDVSTLIGESAILKTNLAAAPPPAPSMPKMSMFASTSAVAVLGAPGDGGRGNPWFNSNPIVAFLINFMAMEHTERNVAMMEGKNVVQSMKLSMQLAYDTASADIAIGEVEKQRDLTQAYVAIAQAACAFASAAVTVGMHAASFKAVPEPKEPSVGAPKASTDAGEDNFVDNPAYEPKKTPAPAGSARAANGEGNASLNKKPKNDPADPAGDEPVDPASPDNLDSSAKSDKAHKDDVKKADDDRRAWRSEWTGALNSTIAGFSSIAGAVGSFMSAVYDPEIQELTAYKDILSGYEKNQQQMLSTFNDAYKSANDEIDKLLSVMQQLIDSDFKSFNINPKG